MRSARAFLLVIAAIAALAAPAGAAAAVTVGSPLTAAPTNGGCGSAAYTNTVLAAALQVPFDGVLVRWRLALGAPGGSGTYRLRVLRPAGGALYTGAGTGPAQTAPLAGVNVITLANPLPVHAGDLVGVNCTSGAPVPVSIAAPSTSTYAYFSSGLPDGSTGSPDGAISNYEALVNADVVGSPTVTAVTPSSGSPGGGTVVTISGSRLADVTGVTFGGVAATGVSPVSDNQLTATAPAHAAGAVDVQVTNAAASSPVTAGDVFTYQAPAPSPQPTPGPGTTPGPGPTPAPQPLNAFSLIGSPRSMSDFTVVFGLNAQAAGLFTASATATPLGAARATRARGHPTNPARPFAYGSGTARLTGAGTVQLHMSPSATARRLLRRGTSLRVKATVIFAPLGAAPATQSTTFAVKGRGRKHKRRR